MIVQTFSVGPLACNCTILADEQTGDAIVVDGGDGVDAVLARLGSNGWRARYLLHTHAHIDHIGDLGRLRESTGGAGLLHPADLPLYRTLGLQARWIGLSEVARRRRPRWRTARRRRGESEFLALRSAAHAGTYARQRLL